MGLAHQGTCQYLLAGMYSALSRAVRSDSVHTQCTQVLQEAQQVFGAAEQEPSRDAAEGMHYTVACLKVQHFQLC